MKRNGPIKNTWFDLLINYTANSIRKTVDGFKDKIVSRFNKNTSKKYVKQTVYGSGNRPSKLKM